MTAVLAMELTPGPNMVYLALLSAQKGRLTGLAAVAGVALGLAVMGGLAALGVTEFVLGNRLAYEALRWSGVAYLVWLAWDCWRESRRPPAPEGGGATMSSGFIRGLATNLLNPKAFLFYVTVLPTFLSPGRDDLAGALALTILYVCVATLVHLVVIVSAGGLTRVLGEPRRREALGIVFAVMLIAVAVWMAVKTAT
ncbi:MAG: LysE family translocator [Alphaproteobacteria bacterium]